MPKYGCFSTGIIYSAIGIIAILSFFRLKDGGADENRLMAWLDQYLMGKIIVLIILAGTVCYIIWRFHEAVSDPYGYGKGKSGIAKRTGIALSTLADVLIAFSASRFLFAKGGTDEKDLLPQLRLSFDNIMQKDNGEIIVVSLGGIVIITAIVQLIYGVTRGYRERLEVEEFSPASKKIVHFLGIAGYVARGIIIGITGWFYLIAGLKSDAGRIVDTDKAFDFVGDNIGHPAFIILAAGTIFYGLFMFALGSAYDIDRDL